MKNLTCILFLLLLAHHSTRAQAKMRRLPSIINHPSLNLYAPYVSFDGDALLFVSDDGEDHALTVSYTSRENDWQTPVVLPKNLNNRLLYQNGFALSADGKTMYFTSSKSPTVGGYDIVMSELKGTTWTEPQNLLLPINSKSNEGSPSFTADGNTIYFMRCTKMDQNSADGCKLFFSTKKPNGQWEDPKEMPSQINTGNAQTPRIMADSETLIFSSNSMASGKGGMDLYTSKFIDGHWTNPVPMDFVNTEKDDQFVSVTALGRYLLKDAPGARRTNELVEFLIPDELRPRGMMKVEGTVTDEKNMPISTYISVTDLSNNSRFYSGRPNSDGTYMLYLMEGTRYEMSFDPELSNIGYFAKQFDLTTDKIPQRERLNVALKQPEPGDEFSLDLVSFLPSSAELTPSSETELKRLTRLAKANPLLKFEIQVMLQGYEQDSIQSNPDLTEIAIDTIRTFVDTVDSLGMVSQRDTIVVNSFYHNDRTVLQSQHIIDYLVTQGADPNKLTSFHNAIPALTPEDRKLIIKAVARNN